MSEVHDIPAYNPADLSSLEGLLFYLCLLYTSDAADE